MLIKQTQRAGKCNAFLALGSAGGCQTDREGHHSLETRLSNKEILPLPLLEINTLFLYVSLRLAVTTSKLEGTI